MTTTPNGSDDFVSEETDQSVAAETAPAARKRRKAASAGPKSAPARPGKPLRQKRGKQSMAKAPSSESSHATEATDVTSSEEATASNQWKALRPKSSGLFDFADHLVENVLTAAEREALAGTEYTFAELGAGYATGTMCAAGLQQAFANKADIKVAGTCQFYSEQVGWKREIIKRIHERVCQGQGHPCHVFVNTGDLSKQILTTDAEENLRQLPEHKFVFLQLSAMTYLPAASRPRVLWIRVASLVAHSWNLWLTWGSWSFRFAQWP